MNAIDLKGRTAIVTGGARGIGFATAQKLLASGAAVALWDIDAAALDKAAAALKQATAACTPRVVDVTDEASIARRRRRADPRCRQDRYPRQQCRHHRRQCAAVGACARGLAARRRGQSDRAVSDLPRGRAAHDRRRLRADRQHRLDRRQGRQSERLALFGVESRPDRADQIARQGIGDDGRAGELHHAGRGQDRAVRADDASSTSTTCCRKSR